MNSVLFTTKAGFRHTFVLNPKSLVGLAISILLLFLVGAWRIKNYARRELEQERALQQKQNIIPFERKARHALTRKGLEIWQSFNNTRAIARFNDSYFAATAGGLIELSQSGNLLRHYSVIDGLPESDLLSLAVFDSKLFIGTRTQGLVSFDGQIFESYQWRDRDPQAIDCLLEDAGRLFVGTMAGGLIGFDGRQFREITIGTDHKRLLKINYLSKAGSQLFVGTFDDGLWIEEGERWSHFTMADGLLSNRVVGVVANRENLFVASDYGLSVAPTTCLALENSQVLRGCFRAVSVMPTLSGMVETPSGILLMLDDGESFTLATNDNSSRTPRLNTLAWARPTDLTNCRSVALDRDLWMLTSEGIRRAGASAFDASLRQTHSLFSPFGQTAAGSSLNSNLISALLLDGEGRLWAGSFRNGISVIATDGHVLAHLETEAAREINSLIEDRDSKTVLAATSQGLLRFDEHLRQTGSWSTRDGLLSNSVMQAALLSERAANETAEENHARNFLLACATSKGLSIGVAGHLRGLTTVQGLPSNSLYAVFAQGRRIYAGTLGGLAVIEDGRIVRVFTDTNSSLTHNWVTALSVAGGRLFVGTYGGGVFELTAAGELRSFAAETGRAVVNPNAMWSYNERLYVGTLDGALIFDLHTQKWTRVSEELPARTVLSITGDEGHVYFGTTGGVARIEKSYWNQAE
ncbi:MAG: hypothetical protein AUG51_03175 [Acidobacteria bacterium 13_1_20CM_3_53_8]|nr:MAG: hypothetical protein AUG51_03175 [Acidobacteria bacterium 13_1_20CM_3_53_8]